MSKAIAGKSIAQESDDLSEIFDEEISNRDYGFVLDSTGNLKAVFWPSDKTTFETPRNVLAICKAFGIADPGFEPGLLH